MITRYFKENAVVQPKELIAQKELLSLSIAELRKLAADRNVELPSRATKIEIVKALSESEQ